MHTEQENILRAKIGEILADGLETQLEPFPETHKEFGELLAELRKLPPDDLEGKLVLSGFADKPYDPDQMRCLEGILLIPLILDSAGGLLVKIKNLNGDRIVHAQEFFRYNDYLEEFQERFYKVRWEGERAALLIIDVALSKPSATEMRDEFPTRIPLSDERGKMREALAVQSFEEVLKVINIIDHPSEYAMIQNNLGNALQYASSSHAFANNLRALEAYDEALRVRNRRDTPMEYANTIANKANVLRNLPDDTIDLTKGNRNNLKAAYALYQETREMFNRFG
jgi:hypothetical protein